MRSPRQRQRDAPGKGSDDSENGDEQGEEEAAPKVGVYLAHRPVSEPQVNADENDALEAQHRVLVKALVLVRESSDADHPLPE